jgi:serine/threonine-protein kinase RsbW
MQQIDLCAAEAVANVMTHGEAGGGTAIDLRLQRDGDAVVFEIEDDGVAFDPTTAPAPQPVTLESDRVGGWGVRIVQRLSDDMRYQRANGRNRLTLVFHPRPPAAA